MNIHVNNDFNDNNNQNVNMTMFDDLIKIIARSITITQILHFDPR